MSLFQVIPLFGSVVNALAIIAGASLGILLHSRISRDIMKLPQQFLGMFPIILGIDMVLKSQHQLVVLFSLAVGSIAGGLMNLESRTERGVQSLEARMKKSGFGFSEAFMSSTLLFGMGSMAILGAFEEGLGGYPALLLTKSVMDGLMSIAMGATLGAGVLFSAVPIFLYQGALTLAAGLLQPYLSGAAVVELSAVGGLMLMGIGLNILGLAKVKVMDALPALPLVVLIVRLLPN